MVPRWRMVLALGLLASMAGAQDAPPQFKSDNEKISYALGMDLGKRLRAESLQIDPDALGRGFKDAFTGDKTLLTDEEFRAVAAQLQDLKQPPAASPEEALNLKDAAAKNERDGSAYLAENMTKAGVATLTSGVQYRILKAGTGRKPTLTDSVVCHYRGTLIDGTEFDSSYRRKQPATFALARVIKGWSEALQQMPVGSTWQIVIPSSLAYGTRGAGRVIGPNAVLVFEVELISIVDRTATPTAATPPTDQGSSAAVPRPRINVSFKQDARLATGNYGGQVWVSPPTLVRVGEGRTCVIEAKAENAAIRTQPGAVLTWTATDPEMATITPADGKQVTITIQRAGESLVRVASDAGSTELRIKAVYRNDTLHVEISQS